MKAALVIMAAGLGSRYGGNKQVDSVGPGGEILMEYSIHDAIRAGFTKIVFIIKNDMQDLMRSLCGDRIAGLTARDGEPVEVCYAVQDYSSLPVFYTVPAGRTKPFGTTHAVLCARPYVQEPFCVINADDYYGVDAFKTIYAELSKLAESGEGTMVGYDVAKNQGYFDRMWKMVVAWNVYMVKKFGYPISGISDHAESYRAGYGSNHGDVGQWWPKHGKSMDALRKEVQEILNGETEDDDMDVARFKELWGEMRKELQDNDASAYSAEAREWATKNGLIAGNGMIVSGEPNCMWGDILTREQFVTVLYRWTQMMGKA